MFEQAGFLAIIADLIVGVHFMYVMFVVLGQLTIILGWIVGWTWIRNIYFRVAHVIAILIVAAQAILDVPCPLTVWENRLREMAGQAVEWDISFIGRLLRLLIFYDFPSWFFTVLHVGFASIVVLSLVLIPPKWSSVRKLVKK